MKLFGRRVFTKHAPLGLAAAGVTAANYTKYPPDAPTSRDNFGLESLIEKDPTEPGTYVDPFRITRNAFYELRNKHISRRAVHQRFSHARIPYNIDVLKSVSHQHKIRMAIKQYEEVQREDESLLDSLARMVGYDRRKDHYNDGPQAAQSSSHW